MKEPVTHTPYKDTSCFTDLERVSYVEATVLEEVATHGTDGKIIHIPAGTKLKLQLNEKING